MRHKNNKGITLIALVVTIVVLIILAVISINLVFNENGIIARAQNAQKMQKLAEEKEKIELAKVNVIIDNRGKLVADEYVAELIRVGVTTQENVKNNEDGSIQIITINERLLMMQTNEEGNVIGITDNGEIDALTVNIKNVQLTAKTNTIKIVLEVERGEGATYTYSHKLESGDYVEDYSDEDTSYTIKKLENGTSYWVKIEAANNYGTVVVERLVETKSIVTGQESEGDIAKIGAYSDQFADIEGTVGIDNLGDVPAEAFVQEAINREITTEDNVSINSNNNYEFITKEGYVFGVIQVTERNVEVNYIGMVEE